MAGKGLRKFDGHQERCATKREAILPAWLLASSSCAVKLLANFTHDDHEVEQQEGRMNWLATHYHAAAHITTLLIESMNIFFELSLLLTTKGIADDEDDQAVISRKLAACCSIISP